MALRVRVAAEAGDAAARVLVVRHRRGVLRTPAYAAPADFIDKRFLPPGSLGGLVELAVRRRPGELRSIAMSERLELSALLRQERLVKRIPGDSLVVAVPVFDVPRRDPVFPRHAEFYAGVLSYLTFHPRVDVACTPMVYGASGETVKAVVAEFLESASSIETPVALGLSTSYPRWLRVELARLYYREAASRLSNAEPGLICVDYASSNPVARLLAHEWFLRLRLHLERELGAPVVLYAANTRYSKVPCLVPERPARDLAAYYAGVDAAAPNRLQVRFSGTTVTGGPLEQPRLLLRQSYTYVLARKLYREGGLDDIAREAGVDPEELRRKLRLVYLRDASEAVRRLNTRLIIAETRLLQRLVEEGEAAQHLASKKAAKMDPRILEAVTRARRIAQAGSQGA